MFRLLSDLAERPVVASRRNLSLHRKLRPVNVTYVFHLLELVFLGIIVIRQTTHNQKANIIMADIQTRLQGINDRLSEASEEIVKLIGELRALVMPPEAEALLAQIEAKATALADIVPNTVPPAP